MPIPVIARGAVVAETLIWFEAKNRETGVVETIGLWTGARHQSFNIDGRTRKYLGGGGALKVDPLIAQKGLNVQSQTVKLSGIAGEVEHLLNAYDARQAPVEMHLARFDPDTNALIGLDRVFGGWLDKAPSVGGKRGGKASVTTTLVSAARILTRSRPTKRSDATQQLQGGDRLLRYNTVSGSVKTYVGMTKQ